MHFEVLKYQHVDDEIETLITYCEIQEHRVIVKVLFPIKDDPARLWNMLKL